MVLQWRLLEEICATDLFVRVDFFPDRSVVMRDKIARLLVPTL